MANLYNESGTTGLRFRAAIGSTETIIAINITHLRITPLM
jgi:hypothetical protein